MLGPPRRYFSNLLSGMLKKYVALVDLVDTKNEHMARVFGEMGFSESAY